MILRQVRERRPERHRGPRLQRRQRGRAAVHFADRGAQRVQRDGEGEPEGRRVVGRAEGRGREAAVAEDGFVVVDEGQRARDGVPVEGEGVVGLERRERGGGARAAEPVLGAEGVELEAVVDGGEGVGRREAGVREAGVREAAREVRVGGGDDPLHAVEGPGGADGRVEARLARGLAHRPWGGLGVGGGVPGDLLQRPCVRPVGQHPPRALHLRKRKGGG